MAQNRARARQRLSDKAAESFGPLTKHLTQHELARRWGLSARTLERWRWTSQGPRFLRLGGRVVYRLEDIEAYETERLHASTTERIRPVCLQSG